MTTMENVDYIDLQKKSSSPPEKLNDPQAIKAIQVKFDELIKDDSILSTIFDDLKAASIPAVVFGGWVRDQYISFKNNINLNPRDIDIVVKVPKGRSLDAILTTKYEKTMFGGFVVKTDRFSLDIWPVKDTYLIKELALKPEIETLPSTTVFSINSVIFYPSQLHEKSMILESGFIKAVDSNLIAFRSSRIPFPTVQVARAIMYSAKCSFKIHDEVKVFIKSECKSPYKIQAILDGINKYSPQKYKEKSIEIFNALLNEFGLNSNAKTQYFNHCWGVFEGGGVRAAALAGAYESAAISGVNFGRVAGTSAGSIIAALISSGATPEFVLNQLSDKNFKDFMRPAKKEDNTFGEKSVLSTLARKTIKPLRSVFEVLENSGLHSSIEIQEWLDKLLCELLGVSSPAKFKDLKLPLYVVASDIAGGAPRIWSKEKTPNDSVAFAVRCSCSIPFYFQPVSDGSSLLVDGGMLSNLPAWVFSTPEIKDKSSRILCFRLMESNCNSKVNGVIDYIEQLISTVVGGTTDIQLQLQRNAYTVDIPTGDFKATDFEKVDHKAKAILRESGFNSVRKFIERERITIKEGAEDLTYTGFDEKLLLLAQYLSEANKNILIVSSNSYWLYFLFPILAIAIKRGIKVNTILKPAEYDDFETHEKHRQELLENIGIGVHCQDTLPFDGFIIDGPGNDTIAAISTASGNVGKDYMYAEELIRIYRMKAYDAPIIKALNNQVKNNDFSKNEEVSVSLESIKESVVFDRLKLVPQYRNAKFSLESVEVNGRLLTLDLHVKEFKLYQVQQLIKAFKDANIELFSPASFIVKSGGITKVNSIVTPPILEKVGNDIVIIEGHTRFFYALKNNISTLSAIIVSGVHETLPASTRPISVLNLASDTIERNDLFENLDRSKIREIEATIHPIRSEG